MYVVTIPVELPLVVLPQLVTPALPETSKVTAPEGASALVLPVTVAVSVNVPPRTGVPETLSATVGVAVSTKVVVDDARGATKLYAVSPGNVNVAPYVPAVVAITLHVYVATLLTRVGPVVA